MTDQEGIERLARLWSDEAPTEILGELKSRRVKLESLRRRIESPDVDSWLDKLVRNEMVEYEYQAPEWYVRATKLGRDVAREILKSR